MTQVPKPYDAVLGGSQRSFRDDIEVVLQQIEQENRAVEGELARVKLNYEQQMVRLLMEKGARQMSLPLIEQLKELETKNGEYYGKIDNDNRRLRGENRALKAQLAAIRYELNQGEVKRDRLLDLINLEFSDELEDLIRVVRQARVIANWYRNGKKLSQPRIRHLANLIEEFETKYPHFFWRSTD